MGMEPIFDLEYNVVAWLDVRQRTVRDDTGAPLASIRGESVTSWDGRSVCWYRAGVFWAADGVVAHVQGANVSPMSNDRYTLAGRRSSLAFTDLLAGRRPARTA